MSSKSNTGKASSVPFYSPEIGAALLSILHADSPSTSTLPPRLAANGSLHFAARGAVIRGKCRASAGSDSDSSVGEAKSCSSSPSSSSSSSEQDRAGSDADATRAEALAIQSAANKRFEDKRCSDKPLSKSTAPSFLLPLPTDSQLALHVPTILLPNKFLRDNPSISSVASRLLSTWHALHGQHPAVTDRSLSLSPYNPTIVIVLIQSGRFASAVYSLVSNNNNNNNSNNSNHHCPAMTMLAHKTSTRYTIRKGQGGSQSNFDQHKAKAKSMGAQLRREGERQLRNDVLNTWKEWKKLGHIDKCNIVFVSCPKGMRRDYLYGGENCGANSSALLEKGDERWRNIPLDVGRPTLEAVGTVMECVFRCSVRDMTHEEKRRIFLPVGEEDLGDHSKLEENGAPYSDRGNHETVLSTLNESEAQKLPVAPPYTPLHDAVVAGDLCRLMDLIKILGQSQTQEAETHASEQSFNINTPGGPDLQTPLHLASSSTHDNAPAIVNVLLLSGCANPCVVDARGRPPYFLASSDKLRETFRLARGHLGEDYCAWDNGARVGPALTAQDVEMKKAKELEKKRRQRARQKEKKAEQKAAQVEAAAKLQREEEEKKQEEDAKRVRHGLKPKVTTTAANVCDFCQKIAKGKRRNQMFQRLDYAYCSTECVKRHQRELAAAAAIARMGN